MADTLTSLLAIFALLAGKYLGQGWLDPFMGIVGAALVTYWSIGLIRSSSHVLLDMQVPETLRQAIRESIEGTGDERITDLHVWAVGPGIFAAEITVVSSAPRPPGHYRELLPHNLGLVHGTVEVHRCPSPTGQASVEAGPQAESAEAASDKDESAAPASPGKPVPPENQPDNEKQS